MKTCIEVYKVALGYIFEKSTKEYSTYYIPFLNLITTECFELNNYLRETKGMEVLTEIPQYEKDEDEVLFEVELVNEVLPLGLAAHIAKEDEQALYNVYIQMYENAKERIKSNAKVILKPIEVVY